MINFQNLNKEDFLSHYWQKKPLVFRKALPDFFNPLSGDELAGLALEEEVESRLVIHTPEKKPYWHLKRGPFHARDFTQLPPSHWTLLVQGVDRFIPEVAALLEHFNFLPHWRIDDVMISYAVEQGSVGPHYDHYDVFLFQAQGRRKWLLTSKHCEVENYLPNVELRIMDKFLVEEEFILEAGDMLYLPPHIAHHGISLSPDCMTYSFGYRSYQSLELWESFGEYLAENSLHHELFHDPDWCCLNGSGELPEEAIHEAKRVLQNILDDEKRLRHWFGCFVTRLDQQAEELLPLPNEETDDRSLFLSELENSPGLTRNSLCRFAYQIEEDETLTLFINGCGWNTEGVSAKLIKLVADKRFVPLTELTPYLNNMDNQLFLYELWELQWIDCGVPNGI